MVEANVWQNLFQKGKVFTLSNLLSLIRLIGSLPIYYLTLNHRTGPALGLAVALILTDYFDGYLARKMNQVSELGKVLDPLADKLCGALATVALHQSYGLPLWVVVVVIGRDVLIVFGALILLTRLPYVAPSEMLGKIAVTILALLYLVYLLELEPLQLPMQYITAMMFFASLIHYAHRFLSRLREQRLMER